MDRIGHADWVLVWSIEWPIILEASAGVFRNSRFFPGLLDSSRNGGAAGRMTGDQHRDPADQIDFTPRKLHGTLASTSLDDHFYLWDDLCPVPVA